MISKYYDEYYKLANIYEQSYNNVHIIDNNDLDKSLHTLKNMIL